MYGMYMLRMEEMKLDVGRSVQEKFLYHVTTESRAMESLNSGLDWRRTRRNKFGCGVLFSDDADYANYYADNFSSEGIFIFICFSNRYQGSTLVIPPNQADTTMSHNKRVIVKYNNNEFYPIYFVYYQRRPDHRTTSKYNHANSRRLQLEDAIEAMNIYDDPYGGKPF
jgi:hypothetical protein